MATGAGMSRESGLPTFRDAQTGLWARYDAEALATPAAFELAPARVFGWYAWRRALAARAQPHPGYRAIVDLESLVPELLVITQNVDGFHRRVGSRRVVELHGALDRFRCHPGGHPFPAERIPITTTGHELDPPRCDHCAAPVRPDVVWFGEALPEAALTSAWTEAARCDVMLVVGTSGLVYPAAFLPRIARDAGAVVVEVNPEASEHTTLATIVARGPAGTVLPRLVRALEQV